ncbi:prolyl oligopeptidase family serine peptidase [Dokdonella sp.]|uniref:prolyl oligopeptidase family serine peptidase n=1 Tax=Dokdonella sp. TaxID=2291710 RepID=UPI0031C217B0|nr:prolyl oligopeptidase family serine peptidase [Dokdonella sp.]
MTLRAISLAGALLAMSLAAFAGPPVAPVRDVPQMLHGVTVHDPYRDFEDLKSPSTQAWLKTQGAYAESVLANMPERQALTDRVEALSRSTGDLVGRVVRGAGEQLFYLKRAPGHAQFKLVARSSLTAPERTLVDPDEMTGRAGGVPYTIDYFMPSWDGKYVAYGLSAGGSEDASLYVMDVASGKTLGEPISRVHDRRVHWTSDSRSLSYNQVRALPPGTAPTEAYLDSTVFLLRVGMPERSARALFGPLVDKDLRLERLDVGEVYFHPTSRFMVARTTDTTVPEGKLFVAPLSELTKATIAWRQVSAFADRITDMVLAHDTLYLRTTKGAPRGRWLALDLAAGGGIETARVVMDAPGRGVLDTLRVGGHGALYVEVSEGFTTRTLRVGSAGKAPIDMAPAIKGSTFSIGDPLHSHDDLWIVSSSWTEPFKVLRTIGPTQPAVDTGLLQLKVPPGTPPLTVSEVTVPSHDGVQVPLAIIHRADLKRDAPHPTLLEGYGAYGHSFAAYFDPRSMAWLERGGVLAYANVRGSGAFGDDWHRAGFKATKPNTWKDGIASAKYLIDKGYATPATLGIWGTSAGGIFVGRAVTEAPQLFAAAVFEVGIMDMLRFEESANGITNVSEFGSVKDEAGFKALRQMSTYHHITDRTAYPAVLFIHGMNDPRVDVWHSAKAAARLQAASTSGKPILLRLDGQAGHGLGSTAGQENHKLADIYAFLLWQFGEAASRP